MRRLQAPYCVHLAALALVATALLPHRAEALRVRGEVHLVAWSGDGATALLHDGQAGPEGGGSSAFLLLSARGVRRFLLSSDFSPGDGSRPQSVPAAECTRRAEALSASLKRSGFTGVTVRPGGCRDRGRLQIVDLDPREVERASGSELPAERELRGWRRRSDAGGARVERAGGAAIPLAGATDGLRVFVSPGDRMVLVFRQVSGDEALAQAFALEAGAARALSLAAEE